MPSAKRAKAVSQRVLGGVVAMVKGFDSNGGFLHAHVRRGLLIGGGRGSRLWSEWSISFADSTGN
jgi:hypothetical protein